MTPRRTLLATVLALALAAAPATANPITYSFTGTVSQDFTDNPLGGTFANGQSARGFITVDPGVVDSDASTDSGFYLDAILAFTINIGSYTASAVGGSVDLVNDLGGSDTLHFGSALNGGIYEGTATVTGAPVAGLSLGILELGFVDSSALALDSDGFPASLILGNWGQAWGVLGFQSIPGGDEHVVSFSLESVAPVPEPATLVLLGSGLASVIGAHRRRQRRRAGRTG